MGHNSSDAVFILADTENVPNRTVHDILSQYNRNKHMGNTLYILQLRFWLHLILVIYLRSFPDDESPLSIGLNSLPLQV